ncbi:MAG: PDZ domain-containing protein [Acidobacteriota bacterium]|nr:PDZ domain-containing protein [Acidobacteriota bacterium]MDQ5837809.1 PDZ domain-containing protein [Acidobacteriota bacterium]
MKHKALLALSAFALLASTAVAASAQNATPALPAQPEPPAPFAAQAPSTPPAPSTVPAPSIIPAPAIAPAPFATTFFDGGNFLGVHVEEVTRENAGRYGVAGEPRGVGVREVVKGSPAERAGLRAGDVIVRFDGEAVTSVRKLSRLIEESAPEHAARLTVLRNGSEQEVSVTLASERQFVPTIENGVMSGALGPLNLADTQRFSEEWARNSEKWRQQSEEMSKKLEELGREHPGVFALGGGRRIGVGTQTLGKQLADYFGVSHGVLVSSVESNSPAERAGLRAGDVITAADGKEINNAGDLVRALAGREGGKDDGEVTLSITREHKQRTVRVKPERGGPQGLYINPGDFRVLAPVASVVPPRVVVAPQRIVVAPRALMALPRTPVAPRAVAPPRVRVPPVRMRVFGPGDRVL